MKYLSSHIKAKHTESGENHICDICSKAFKNVHTLRGHKRKLHEEIREVSCPSCSKVFANKIMLYDHERAVQTLKDSICPACARHASETRTSFSQRFV